jgi:transposase-like protein
MREIYFSTFKLGEKSGSRPALEDVLPSLKTWCFGPRREIDMPEEYERFSSEQSFDFVTGTSLETQHHEGDEGRAYALRLRHPDTSVEGKRWMTEVVLFESIQNGKFSTRASIGLSTGFEGTTLTRDEEVVSRPRLVWRLVDEYGAYETLPLQSEPRKMYSDDVGTFLRLLTYTDRNFPVVWITARNADGNYVIDPDPVADWLVGVAHVISSESADVSRAVGEKLPRPLNCFDGAARIYWPGFSTNDSRYHHQLWLSDQIEDIEEKRQYGFREELLRTIADATTNRVVGGTVRWSDVSKLRSRSQLEALRDQGDTVDVEFAEKIFERIDDLEERNEALQEELENVRDDLDKARNQVQYWRNQYISEASGNGQDSKENKVATPPTSLSEAVEKILERYGPKSDEPDLEELSLEDTTLWIPNSVQGKVKDAFEEPASAHDALEWIATTFHHAKAGKESCSDFDTSCRGASGFWYEAHQRDTTMGKYEEDYTVRWKDEKRNLEKHVGKGSSKDPRHTLRIAFFFDEEEEVVVVGYIGQHQQTDAT